MATRLALEQLAGNQFSTFNNGGKVMVSASVAGKSFSYQLQPGMNPAALANTAYEIWQRIYDMTAEQLENYMKKSNGRMSYPNFGVMSPINP